ncbi:MAG: 4-(cytidine 5'-diphospho)-2-C-methyl-D-erythritol kinase [Oscillospiraceae bacterium]|nr:4-(cytidine 5'-diphospho)-2-C-methyl-D-erythritol kinase [Oscillospiraceae bacterium]
MPAYAKVNLSLDILGKRGDGYHELRMVTQTVSLCDELTIELSDDAEITASCGIDYIPSDGRNLAVAAVRLFFDKTGLWNGGARITIDKRIPVCAGLGGGSADAAAVLRGLNTLPGAGLDTGALREMALALGSDVPFCIGGGTQLMEGRGEILTPLPPLPDCYIVICKPRASMSTQTVFSWVRADKIKYRPDNDGMIKALRLGNLSDTGRRMYNVLEDAVSRQVPDIPVIRGVFLDGGAIGACMTGTGSAVAGLFDDFAAAESSCKKLSETYPETFLTTPVKAYT